MATSSPADIANAFDRLEKELPDKLALALTQAGARLEEDARSRIGTERAEWPPLAGSTIVEKQRLHFVDRLSPTDPLLRTGELRASISASIDQDGITLGSTDPVMVFHEHGTDRMPARPVLGPTVAEHAEEIAHTIAGTVAEAIRDALTRRR